MIPAFRLAFLGALLLCFAHSSFAQKKYALPERGFFQMNVPAGWSDQVREAGSSLPPTLAFRPVHGQPFEVRVTPIWRAGPDAPVFTKDWIRQQVWGAVDEVKEQSLEQNIALVEFASATGPGYYFNATDRSPKAGEYKHLLQGMVKVNELVVTFTVLTNAGQEQVTNQALTMIRTSVHVRP
ncbi:MAG TPA: hypothetical protein VKE95_04530 [Burkholderiales bacterium]|nr:hypothetical protein [Burkholderiales bacterium]